VLAAVSDGDGCLPARALWRWRPGGLGFCSAVGDQPRYPASRVRTAYHLVLARIRLDAVAQIRQPKARRRDRLVTAYVANAGSGTVTPIRTSTNQALKPISVGSLPVAVAITPDGKTAYVVNEDSDSVTPIRTATNSALAPIRVGFDPEYIAITPNGKTVYVVNFGCPCPDPVPNTVTAISTVTNRAVKTIAAGSLDGPDAIAITPDGHTAYVADAATDTVTPINAAPLLAAGRWSHRGRSWRASS